MSVTIYYLKYFVSPVLNLPTVTGKKDCEHKTILHFMYHLKTQKYKGTVLSFLVNEFQEEVENVNEINKISSVHML